MIRLKSRCNIIMVRQLFSWENSLSVKIGQGKQYQYIIYIHTYYLQPYQSSLPLWWCNSSRVRIECGRSWVRAPIGSIQSPKYNWYLLLLRQARSIKEKEQDWLARIQNNMSKWSDMSTHGLSSQSARTMKIQLSVLVQKKRGLYHHLVEN